MIHSSPHQRLDNYFSDNPDHGTVRQNQRLQQFTSLRCGGAADFFCDVHTIEGLRVIVEYCANYNVPLKILGYGTNVLVVDEGVTGVVSRLIGDSFLSFEQLDETRFQIGSRVSLKKIIAKTVQLGLSGCEWLTGIPASLGGAISLNAGAYDHCIGQVIERITVMRPDGTIHTFDRGERFMGYREGPCNPDEIIVSAQMRFSPDDKSAIRERIQSIDAQRKAKIPRGHHAGCVFKNPPGISAGKLLDELGCKGIIHEAALVSARHANIIMNDSHARSFDILQLIERLKNKAKFERNIDLELELKIWS